MEQGQGPGEVRVSSTKPVFPKGTFGVADALAANESAITIIGGGDSVAAVEKAGLAAKMSHISTELGVLEGLLERGLRVS